MLFSKPAQARPCRAWKDGTAVPDLATRDNKRIDGPHLTHITLMKYNYIQMNGIDGCCGAFLYAAHMLGYKQMNCT